MLLLVEVLVLNEKQHVIVHDRPVGSALSHRGDILLRSYRAILPLQLTFVVLCDSWD